MALGSRQGTTLNDSFVPTAFNPTSLPPPTFVPTSSPNTFVPPTTTVYANDGGGGGGGSGGFLSANGTPALVLAFLAIGLFAGGAIGLFGLRRYVRDRRDPNGRWARRRRALMRVGEEDGDGAGAGALGGGRGDGRWSGGRLGLWDKVPELWDLHARGGVVAEWADIQVNLSSFLPRVLWKSEV